VISVEQGYDPGSATLIAFGGAGPLHGCAVAESLGMEHVLIPMHTGVFSALGLLRADVVRDKTQTMIRREPDIEWEEIKEQFEKMQQQLEDELRAQGIQDFAMAFEWEAALRYRGQSYELSIPWQDNMAEAFHQAHERKYLFRHDDRPVEIVNLYVRGIGDVAKPDFPEQVLQDSDITSLQVTEQTGFYDGREIQIPVIPRDILAAGATGTGPFIIKEQTSTTFVPPDWSCRVDTFGHLRLTKNSA